MHGFPRESEFPVGKLRLVGSNRSIPSLYYGIEQGLSGTVDGAGNADLCANESSREALWGKPNAFDMTAKMFQHVQALSKLRASEPPLTYDLLNFREVSGNGADFGHSFGPGALVAFSRILADWEVLVVANTGTQQFSGTVLVDRDINATPRRMRVAHTWRDHGQDGMR